MFECLYCCNCASIRFEQGKRTSFALRVRFLGSWDFPLFQRLLDEAGYEDKHLLHDISCLPLIGLAPVSSVLSPKSVLATVSLSDFWSKVPQRNVEVFNRVGPTVDSELDRRASGQTHEEFALGLMDGPYNSLEECPGGHKVLVRRKPRWQSGDVRNIDDCSENGINETFESRETYKPCRYLPPRFCNQIVGNLPSWCHASWVCCRFVETFQADWHWFEPSLSFSGATTPVLGNLEGYAVAFLELQLVSKGVLVFQWQCVHFCNIICLFQCSTIKMITIVLNLLAVLHMLGRSSSNFMVFLVRSWPHPGGENFPFPSQVYRLLGTKVDLTVSPREIQVLPSRVDSICSELKQILASKKLGN